jgi:UDP-N-acetylglucosamine 2-epimerase
MARPALPFGDGRASARIVEVIEAFFARPRDERRPTARFPLPSPALS